VAWACIYAAVWVFLIIYFLTCHTIDRREREKSYNTGGYFNISDNSSAWAGIHVNKSGPTDV
jgi:hypothetical protein